MKVTQGQKSTLKCSILSLLKMPKGENTGNISRDYKNYSQTKTWNLEETVVEVPESEMQGFDPTGEYLSSRMTPVPSDSEGECHLHQKKEVLYLWNCSILSVILLVVLCSVELLMSSISLSSNVNQPCNFTILEQISVSKYTKYRFISKIAKHQGTKV